MRLRSCWFLLVLCAIFEKTVFAGQNVGNGGAVVQGTCDGRNAGTVMPAELLDFWEVRYRTGLNPALGSNGDSVDVRVEVAFRRIERLDPIRAARYRQWYQDFWGEAVEQDPRFPFPPLSDVGNVSPLLPGGCMLVKVIEQRRPESVFLVKRYFIRRDIFDNLSTLTQTGLILHEIIYRDAIERGHGTSMKARLVTGFLASSWADSATVGQYEGLLAEQGLLGYMSTAYESGILRYFDEKPRAYMDAVAFCNHLAGDSRLAISRDANFDLGSSSGNARRSSAIGAHILGNDNSGSATMWLATDVQRDAKPWLLDTNRWWFTEAVPITDELPYLCWQAESASPWN